MKGLSSGMLAKTTSLAQPKPCRSAVASAIWQITCAHLADGVHVDARLVRGHVDRRADAFGLGEHLGQGLHHHRVGRRDALVDQGGEAAHEIDAALVGRRVERLGNCQRPPLAVPGQDRARPARWPAAC